MKRTGLLFLLITSFVYSQTKSIKVNSVKPEMVLVEGGIVKLGCDSDNGCNRYRYGVSADERRILDVSVNTFKIAKTETTVAQWRAFCLATNRSMPKLPQGWPERKDSHPMTDISRNEVLEYCKWLSKTHGGVYRLPTVPEWEFAAKGGNKTLGFEFSGSNILDEVGWYRDNCPDKRLISVGRKKPNELGLYDMSGNAFEMTSSFYTGSYSDVEAFEIDHNLGKEYRGGSVRTAKEGCTVTVRLNLWQNYLNRCDEEVGFRVVLSE